MSHAIGVDPYPDVVKVREPVARPLDVVAVELLLSAAQAFVAGVLMYLAIGIWDDRGVGVGPVAVILALLGIAVGASWLFWLLGGTGWPLAAANVPTAMFLGFALILGWQGDGIIRLDALPLILALAGSVFGIVCGVFLDSPRRWRWDQRQKLRPGTEVPRVSPTTKAVVARVPRSLPTRTTGPSASSGASPAAASSAPSAASTAAAYQPSQQSPSGTVGTPYIDTTQSLEADSSRDERSSGADPSAAGASAKGSTPSVVASVEQIQPSAVVARDSPEDSQAVPEEKADEPTETIELPTSVEPKAQRSPWAWAAPPEWNRDDEDDEPRGGPSSRS